MGAGVAERPTHGAGSTDRKGSVQKEGASRVREVGHATHNQSTRRWTPVEVEMKVAQTYRARKCTGQRNRQRVRFQ